MFDENTPITNDVYRQTAMDIVYWTGQLPDVDPGCTISQSARYTIKNMIINDHWDKSNFHYKYTRFDDFVSFAPTYKPESDDKEIKPFHKLMLSLSQCYQDILLTNPVDENNRFKKFEYQSRAHEATEQWGQKYAKKIRSLYNEMK